MKKRVNHNRISDRSGAAMIVAIFIIGIILVFTFALLLVSYTLYASQNKNAASLRCSEAANTLSIALEDELEDPDAYKTSAFYKYLRCNVFQDKNTWPYYEAGKPGHGEKEAFRYMDLRANVKYDQVEGFPGSVKLCMYWTVDDKDVRNLLATKDFISLSVSQRSTARLHVLIITETASQSYTVENIYKVNISTVPTTDEKSKAVSTMASTTYSDTDGHPYNPQELTCGEDNGSVINDIKTTEYWSFELESRE